MVVWKSGLLVGVSCSASRQTYKERDMRKKRKKTMEKKQDGDKKERETQSAWIGQREAQTGKKVKKEMVGYDELRQADKEVFQLAPHWESTASLWQQAATATLQSGTAT